MFQRGRVNDDFGPHPVEDVRCPDRVAHIAEHGLQRQAGMQRPQQMVDLVKVQLARIENAEGLRRLLGHLASQLRSD